MELILDLTQVLLLLENGTILFLYILFELGYLFLELLQLILV